MLVVLINATPGPSFVKVNVCVPEAVPKSHELGVTVRCGHSGSLAVRLADARLPSAAVSA